MKPISFLSLLAKHIVANYSAIIEELVVVLPNKRAKVFLLEELKNEIQQNSFAPKIISIEDFIQDIAGIRSVDSVELLFEFYNVYISLTEKEQQPFEQFSNWGKTLLQDFNEIDRYLLEPNHVFSYLKDIEAIKRWNLEPQDKTKLIENYLLFWENMPLYYDAFYKHLLSKGIGYQGLIYREAVENLNHFSNSIQHKIIFAGFNALNQAEEKIFQHLLSVEKADVLWDVEETFLNDPYHDAGLFARKIKKSWTHYKSNPYEWLFNEFKQPKTIQIMGTPKTIGQAKLVGEIIETISSEQKLENIAVVLGEENMLIPLLHSLPQSVSHLNITMGYSAKNNPAQLLVTKLFKMHQNAFKRSQSSYVFYYKDVLEVLQNPLVEPFAKAKLVVKKMNENNFTFISHAKLLEFNETKTDFFTLLFEKWNDNPVVVLEKISSLLLEIKHFLSLESSKDKMTKSFVYAVFKVINKLATYCEQYNHITSIEGLFSLYKQIIDLAEVSFEGEPLQGLQIMGVLESRVLDFDTVIITSMNEGVFPAGKSQNSFIPLDVKRELGLPTFKEKDAIYTYHFYHLLQRAKNIYLLYNTESEGIDAGEKSRFITQLEVEKQPNHTITHQIYNAYLPEKAHQTMLVEKSDLVMQRLREMAENGFSPSTLTTYIRNPMQFYFQRILRISEVDEVEENIAVNTLGTIIHGALEELYKPHLNIFLSVLNVENMLQLANDEVLKQFKLVYKEGEITKGKNLLAFEVAKRNVFNFLQLEKRLLEQNDAVKVLFLEKNYEQILNDERLPFPIKIKGNVDRIELRNGKLRIIDYKTGKVEQASLSISNWNGLTEDIKYDKIIQLLCYAFMVQSDFPNTELEVGIISFKNLKAGFMPFQIKEGREVIVNQVDDSVLDDFKTELIVLLNEILNVEFPFEEKIL
ncbi:PD-(D/E)XK nuclease family protein [Flavobacterium azooxidireducens]|uniref:PD-(D/E)XK nuclease family protein n=1 Tax=Flavobacterium azooxidireducens TaxID=1871076 RepID=A0ABY4KHM1_9FLAO|nr:PD-(D/E)XK nuclease family protein [Flavobacterium azooxidireducens]UPQ80312.1 PD-(D/E)XK nuclease family protein [Flavobacterium azooxidireducens]